MLIAAHPSVISDGVAARLRAMRHRRPGRLRSDWESQARPAPEPAPEPAKPAAPAWRDAAWAALVGRADTVLRRYYGVTEFTDDPACLLRIELCHAPAAVLLGDGTQIRPGEPVGALHFWNEHLPRFPSTGPDLRWAKTVQGRMATSLELLARFVDRTPEWRDVRALRGCAPFCSRLRAMRIRRVTGRYGFELVDDAALGRPWHAFGENLVLWALTRAFNPAATGRQPFQQERHELWIPRDRLLQRYGSSRPPGSGEC